MRTTVYTIAIGNDHWRQAQVMVQSLRRFGEFDGRIIVYSDRNESITGADNIRMLDLITLPKITMGKAFIGKRCGYFGYDRIVWVDCDVVFIRPIAPLLEPLGTWLPIERQAVDSNDVLAFSIPSNPISIGETGLNAGFISGTGSEWEQMCEIWWDAMVTNKCWENACTDQPMINHLIRHGAIAASPLPHGTMHSMFFNSSISNHTRMVHVRSPLKWETMRMIVGLMDNQLIQ